MRRRGGPPDLRPVADEVFSGSSADKSVRPPISDVLRLRRHVSFVPTKPGGSNWMTGGPLGDPASAAAIEWRVAASRVLVGLSQLGCIEGPTDVPTPVRSIHK